MEERGFFFSILFLSEGWRELFGSSIVVLNIDLFPLALCGWRELFGSSIVVLNIDLFALGVVWWALTCRERYSGVKHRPFPLALCGGR